MITLHIAPFSTRSNIALTNDGKVIDVRQNIPQHELYKVIQANDFHEVVISRNIVAKRPPINKLSAAIQQGKIASALDLCDEIYDYCQKQGLVVRKTK